ncbi:MAG: GNAT family N-acetyltransferase [Planctomycetota bacterium]
MLPLEIESRRLKLVVETLEETRSRIALLPEEHQQMISPAWMARLEAAVTADPWLVGFNIVRLEDQQAVGQIGFKGPPDGGRAEIAYAVAEKWRGNGYATEAARLLAQCALKHCADVDLILAHTLPEENASTAVLSRIGFKKIGTVNDPEDGQVWRWELR